MDRTANHEHYLYRFIDALQAKIDNEEKKGDKRDSELLEKWEKEKTELMTNLEQLHEKFQNPPKQGEPCSIFLCKVCINYRVCWSSILAFKVIILTKKGAKRFRSDDVQGKSQLFLSQYTHCFAFLSPPPF